MIDEHIAGSLYWSRWNRIKHSKLLIKDVKNYKKARPETKQRGWGKENKKTRPARKIKNKTTRKAKCEPENKQG